MSDAALPRDVQPLKDLADKRLSEMISAIRKIDPDSLIKLTITKDPATISSNWSDIWMDGNTGGWGQGFGKSAY